MESSPLLKRRKEVENNEHHSDPPCVICDKPCHEKLKKPSTEQWQYFKKLSEDWYNIDGAFSNVFKTVNWEVGSGYWHKDCKWKMANKKNIASSDQQSHCK